MTAQKKAHKVVQETRRPRLLFPRQKLFLRALQSMGGEAGSHALYAEIVSMDPTFYGPTFYGVVSALRVRRCINVYGDDDYSMRRSWYELTADGQYQLKRRTLRAIEAKS